MMAIFDSEPVMEGWEQFRPPIVLETNLEHFWNIFFDDAAPYATDVFLE